MNTETLFQIIGELIVENRMLRNQSQQQMQTLQNNAAKITELEEKLRTITTDNNKQDDDSIEGES